MAEATGDSVFKVLSGNQLGAEVFLADGTYSFGSGAEADIQLDDVALQAVHGYVRLRDGKVELRAAQGDLVTASGLAISRGDEVWREIAQMDAVSAGLSKFVIAGQNANWSALGPPAPVAAPRKTGTRSLYDLVASMPRQALYGASSVLAILVLAGVVGGFGGDAAQRSAAEIDAEALAGLRQAFEAMPFADAVRLTERADGTIAIEGYVEEQVERRAIQNALDASGLPATLRVFVRENLRADVQGTIDSLQVPASFTLDDAGHLTLSGTVLDPVTAKRLVESIQTGVFGLASVKSDIRTADAILDDLRGIAADAGLADLVIFRLDGLVVEATGIVPRDKMDNWVGLIGVYSRRFAKEIPLRSFVTLDQPAEVDTAPVIIGTGPVADAETGRVVAPETLAEPNEVDAQSLFAGQPEVTPDAPTPVQQPDSRLSGLSAALDRLQDNRPELHDQLVSRIELGETPEPAFLQEVLEAIGGTIEAAPPGETGGPRVVVEGLGFVGTVEGIARDLGLILRQRQQAAAAAASETRAPAALPAPQPAIMAAPLRIGDLQVETTGDTVPGAAPAAVTVAPGQDAAPGLAPDSAAGTAPTVAPDAPMATAAVAPPSPAAGSTADPAPLAAQAALPDAASELGAGPPDAAAARVIAVSTALDRLQARSPALHDRIVALVDAGEVPDTALLAEAITVLGGSAPADGSPDAPVTLPELGPVGTMAELSSALGPAVQARRQTAATTAAPGSVDQAEPPAPLAAPPGSEAVLLALDRLQETRPDLHQRLVTDIAEGRAADPAVLREVVTLMAGGTAEASQAEGGGATGPSQIVVADLGLSGSIDQLNQTISALVAAQSANAPAAAPDPVGTAVPGSVVRIADPAPLAEPAGAGPEGSTTIQASSPDEQPITLPLFALPQGEMVTMQPMIDAANALIAEDSAGDAGSGTLSPNLVMLVAMQNEQLQFGKTLMRLPQPLTALPYSVDQPVSCWQGARLTPGMLPTALLLLDALSVSSDSDVTGLTPDVREVVMETALSPDRVKACLRETGTAFGAMVGGSSTFLSETARNPDFVEFLFRNVPAAQLPLAGANLAGERYVELADGRKLGEGAAPDITSRIMSIGDLGILLRTAEGTRIQLYGSTLGWRVADTCGPEDCGMN